jgi:L-iditol 2-dehydrogenase
VADVDETRLKLSRSLGATEALNSGDNFAAKISQLTKGAGVDIAVEAVGITATVGAAINNTRKGGAVVLVGNVAPEVTIPLQTVVTRQIRLQGSCASAGEYPQAIKLMSEGKINVKPLITAVAPLEEGPRWFERLYSREPNLMKVVLEPGVRA